MTTCRKLVMLGLCLMFMSCAGFSRSCSSCDAENFGADWIVVQYDCSGKVYRCWALRDTSIANEKNSDGIYWESPDGHLVHISGNYNRVQIKGDMASAFREIGITEEKCKALHVRVEDN